MREILFRGRRMWGNKKWVEGDLLHGYNGYVGITKKLLGVETWQVDPETVGQYTGVTAKGKKIFEGDIIKYSHRGINEKAIIRYGVPKDKERYTMYGCMYGWYLEDNHGNTAFLLNEYFIEVYDCLIIGNIYDNPEMLGGESDV